MKNIAKILIVCCMVYLFTGCGVLNQQENNTSGNTKEGTQTNEDIIKEYITEFLTDGYSGYYVINNIQFEFVEDQISGDDKETIILTSMNVKNASKVDPETIPYIKDVKDRAQKETNPERKVVLQNEYETLVQEYDEPFDLNFFLKFTAKLRDGKIDRESIKLYFEQESGSGILYIPAEEVLPKK